MNTKAVYVVVSSDKDVYFEQAWVSAWSLKHYNSEMEVLCVVDQDTYQNINNGYRKNAKKVFDKVVCVEVPNVLPNKERSRWLKTSLREHIHGNYLFIDTDTIICDSISEVDQIDGEIMMVKNGHCLLSKSSEEKEIRRIYKRIFNVELTTDNYYNSGVIFCKDNASTHEFYKQWHDDWKHSVSKGYSIDQQALLHTNEKYNLITDLDGIFNAQVRFSVKYLMTGKILHYFNNMLKLNNANPFYSSFIYQQVKKDQGLSNSIKDQILNCKKEYQVQSYIVAGRELEVRNGESFRLLCRIFEKNPHIYAFIETISMALYRIVIRIRK